MAIGTCYTLVHDGDGGLLAQEDVRCCASPKMTIGAISLSEFAVERLRTALCPPGPAAEARAKLEQAVRDDLLEYFCPSYDNLGYSCLANPKAKNVAMYQSPHYPTEAEALAAAAAHVEGMREVETRFPISDLDLCGCRNELAELTHNQVGMSQTGAPVCWIAGERYEMEEDEDLLHYYQRLVVAAQSDQYNLRAQARAAKQ